MNQKKMTSIPQSAVARLIQGVVFVTLLSSCGIHESRSFVEEAPTNQRIETKGESQLITAIATDDPDALQQAVLVGFSTNHRLSDGQTLLIRAVSLGKLRCVRWLIENGVDTHLVDAEGKSPCEYARASAEIRQLLNCGVDPLILSEAFDAVRSGNVRKVQALLREGLSPNIQEESGETLLIAAVKSLQVRMVEMLLRGFLEKGLDLNFKDHEGKTALAWARQTNQDRLISLLESNGAKE